MWSIFSGLRSSKPARARAMLGLGLGLEQGLELGLALAIALALAGLLAVAQPCPSHSGPNRPNLSPKPLKIDHTHYP